RLRPRRDRGRDASARRALPRAAPVARRRRTGAGVGKRYDDGERCRCQPRMLEPLMRTHARGVSIVELLVATAIGLVVVAAAGGIVLAQHAAARRLQA